MPSCYPRAGNVSRSSYDETVHRIVRKPSAISTMAPDHPQQQHKILSSRPEDLSFGELQLLMECEFQAALYYLPTAWNYVEQMREEWSQVAWNALLVIESRQRELNALGIYNLTTDRIAEVFAAVTGAYQVRPDAELSWASVVGGSERVDLVDAIFKFNMPCGGSMLFDVVIEHWAGVADRWQRSATFLDFFMHKDWSPVGHLKQVFSSPLVVALRRDGALLRRHWALAGPEIERVCPSAYCEYLSGAVLQ
jgi:hypothetical protein